MIKNYKNLLHYARFSFKNVICSRKKTYFWGGGCLAGVRCLVK